MDYRFSLKRGVLLGYHGIQNQFVRAERALEWVYEFLEAQSGECVVVSIKQVRTPELWGGKGADGT